MVMRHDRGRIYDPMAWATCWLRADMAQPVLVDLRNVYRPDEIARHGFVYESIGRPRK